MKLSSLFGQRSVHLIHILPFLCHNVVANTEIIVFSSPREPPIDLGLDAPGNWTTIRPTDHARRWSIEPASLHTPLHQVCPHDGDDCPHELWFLLDLDDAAWASYTTWTLRLSWAASTPTDFDVAVYTQREAIAETGWARSMRPSAQGETPLRTPITTTRSRYARIRAVHAGVPVLVSVLVPTPTPTSHPPPPPRVHPGDDGPMSASLSQSQSRSQLQSQSQSLPQLQLQPQPQSQSQSQSRSHRPRLQSQSRSRSDGSDLDSHAVPFDLILEPAYAGVLPATVLPTLVLLVPIVLAAAALVPWVTAYVEPYVLQARLDAVAAAEGASEKATRKRR